MARPDTRLFTASLTAIVLGGINSAPAVADIVKAPADSVAIVASRQAAAPLADPVIERAVEALQQLDKTGKVDPVKKKEIPDNIVRRSHRRDLEKVLILGGPEVFPM